MKKRRIVIDLTEAKFQQAVKYATLIVKFQGVRFKEPTILEEIMLEALQKYMEREP